MLTDGKAGDEQPCLGVAQAMDLAPETRHVKPRAPFAWLAPWGPIDPRDAPEQPRSPISPPFPDLLIASGRRAVPYLRAVKRASGGRTFTLFLKDPRSGPGTADLIWVPEHDALRGDNVIVTLTTPHRLSPARLAEARAKPDPRLAVLPSPRAAVLVGGDSRHHRFEPTGVERFLADLKSLAESASLMVTASRRTPPLLAEGLRQFARDTRHFVWDGSGENPYLAILALADAVVATADSTNMIGEAAATGRPILVFEPSGGHAKIARFLDGLRRHGAVHRFAGRLEGEAYPPLDSTSTIARAVLERLAHHRRRLNLD